MEIRQTPTVVQFHVQALPVPDPRVLHRKSPEVHLRERLGWVPRLESDAWYVL